MHPAALLRPTQTETGLRGNCWQTATAQLLGVPASGLPDQTALRDAGIGYEGALSTYLARHHGLAMEYADPATTPLSALAGPFNGFHLALGPGPRGLPHVVVARWGRPWHDPHPSRAGLLSTDAWIVLAPADAAALREAASRPCMCPLHIRGG